jgi:hypothetical protein
MRKERVIAFSNVDLDDIFLSDVVSIELNEDDNRRVIITTYICEVFRRGWCCTRV